MTGRTLAVTFALPDEARAFVSLLAAPVRGRGPLATVSGRLAGWQVKTVFTGVGASSDCRARLRAALNPAPDLVISSGFAGALRPGLAVGDLVIGDNHSDPALAETAARLLAGPALHRGRLTTQPLLAETPASKWALGAATGAVAVDMETGWIAAACAEKGIRLLSLRVISDAADQAFPVPGDVLFDVARQRPRYARLPLWLLAHPGQIAAFARFVRGLSPARRRLAAALRTVAEGLVAESLSLRGEGGPAIDLPSR